MTEDKDDKCDWCGRKESEGARLRWFRETSVRICQSDDCYERCEEDYAEMCAENDYYDT